MAQGTGISPKAGYVAISTNGSIWTDISGYSSNVEPDGGERKSGEWYSFDTDYAGLTRGKREPIDLKVSILYTEGASDAWTVAKDAYEGNTALYLRWAPQGNTGGNKQFTTGAGIVTSMAYPAIEAESPDPIMVEFTIKVAVVTPATI